MTIQKKTRERIDPPSPDEVKAIRQALGMTQAEAAREAAISDARVWRRWEQGAAPMPRGIYKMFELLCENIELKKIISSAKNN